MVRSPLPQAGTIGSCAFSYACRSCPPTTRSPRSNLSAHTKPTQFSRFFRCLSYALEELPTDEPHYEARNPSDLPAHTIHRILALPSFHLLRLHPKHTSSPDMADIGLFCMCRSCQPTTRSGMHLFESLSPPKAHTILTFLSSFVLCFAGAANRRPPLRGAQGEGGGAGGGAQGGGQRRQGRRIHVHLEHLSDMC